MSITTSGTTSIHNEREQDERLDLADEVERGILKLRCLTSMDTRFSNSPIHQPIEPRMSLPEHTSRPLRNWFSASPGTASNILWLSGLPVSTNAEDIIALFHGHCLVVASFSFSSRKGSEQIEELVPALALQTCSSIPSLRPVIGLTAFQYPNILSGGLHNQLEALIFNPFRHYTSMEGYLPVILMIDGLELYYDVDTQNMLISIIETVATTSTIPLRFLLTTRQGLQENGLPFQPGSHLHIHNGPSAPRLQRLQSALRLGTSQRPNISANHGFPHLLQTHGSKSDAQSYTRSLIMLGHGVPLWQPQGNLGAHPEYLRQGPQIGDVMYITPEGTFLFIVNIFRDDHEPINKSMQMQGRYSPLTLDPSEVTRVENYFKPGTVITSPGVIASKMSDTPLSVNFKSSVEEGGMLVLPDGASREDIKSTERFHKYVQRWAPYWYRHTNVPNGSIFLVTGCDKASDYACATFYSNPSWRGTPEVDMDFVNREDNEHPWYKQGRARAHNYKLFLSESELKLASTSSEQVRHLCVFIRGMRIALSSAVWSSYNFRMIARSPVTYSNVLHKLSPLGNAAESVLVHIRCRAEQDDALRRVTQDNHIFHPIFALGPDLFQKYPKASVVVINDSDWCMLTQGGHGDWVHMTALIERLHQQFAVVEDHGVISFVRKTADHKDKNVRRGVAIPRLFRMNKGPIKAIPVGKFVHDFGES